MKNLYKLIERLSNRDYIVEQGTSSNWNYRKWKSGRFEAERVMNTGQVTINTVVTSSWMRSNAITIVTPPMMTSGTIEVSLIGSSSNSPIVLESVSSTAYRIAKEATTAVTLQNVTVAFRVVNGRWD